jgi:hypothetical protein
MPKPRLKTTAASKVVSCFLCEKRDAGGHSWPHPALTWPSSMRKSQQNRVLDPLIDCRRRLPGNAGYDNQTNSELALYVPLSAGET